MTGVKSPMKIDKKKKLNINGGRMRKWTYNYSVISATPLLLIDNVNTSLGKTQAIGPRETPYAAVNVYIHNKMVFEVSGRKKTYTRPSGKMFCNIGKVEVTRNRPHLHNQKTCSTASSITSAILTFSSL